jgi:AcrR family transcriptional regulator
MARQQQKDNRRLSILRSAELLIREHGSTEFSMRALAATANVSPATIYNLLGSKATVLYILLNQSLDRVDTARLHTLASGDPVDQVFHAADVAVELYTADARLNQPLQRFVIGESHAVHRAAYMDRAFRYWMAVVTPLFKQKLMPATIKPQDLARDLELYFAGTMTLWIHNELNGYQLGAHIRLGVALRLHLLTEKKYQRKIDQELRKAREIVKTVLPTFSVPATHHRPEIIGS